MAKTTPLKTPKGTGYGPTPGQNLANSVEMSVGNIRRDNYAPPKTSGIKTRGNGAATKGVMARGPMA